MVNDQLPDDSADAGSAPDQGRWRGRSRRSDPPTAYVTVELRRVDRRGRRLVGRRGLPADLRPPHSPVLVVLDADLVRAGGHRPDRRVRRERLILPLVDDRVPSTYSRTPSSAAAVNVVEPAWKSNVPVQTAEKLLEFTPAPGLPLPPLEVDRRVATIEYRCAAQRHVVEVLPVEGTGRARDAARRARETMDRAAVEVHVEEVAARPGLEVDRVGGAAGDELDLRRVG